MAMCGQIEHQDGLTALFQHTVQPGQFLIRALAVSQIPDDLTDRVIDPFAEVIVLMGEGDADLEAAARCRVGHLEKHQFASAALIGAAVERLGLFRDLLGGHVLLLCPGGGSVGVGPWIGAARGGRDESGRDPARSRAAAQGA